MATILLVDDDAAVLAGLRKLLERSGHEVLEASDGREALGYIETCALDLVVTDVNMPEMDGMEVLMTMRQKNVRLPVIAISGGGKMPTELLLRSAGMLGAVTTLAKPLELSQLQDAVDEALASRA